jgi:hypothetical protein
MSGSRALASARRRRAAPPDNVPPRPPPSPVPTRDLNESTVQNESPNPKFNALNMLMAHDKILQNLTTVCDTLNRSSEQQQEEFTERMNEMKLDDTNIDFFKDKVRNLEQQMNEIKKHILKVQTFAMETNLQFMQMKKSTNVSEEEEQTMENAGKVSDILLNDNNEENAVIG